MKRILSVLAASSFCLLISGPIWAAADQSPDNQATIALHQLFKTAWQREMREHPLEASSDGFHEYDGEWPDVSLAAIAREHAENLQTLKDLAAIDRSQLAGEDQISYDLFKYRYEDRVGGYGFGDYLMPMNQLSGIQTLSTLTQTLRFDNTQDYENYIKRLQTLNVYMDQTIALLQEGVKRGMTEPQVVMKRIPHQIAANIVAKPD
ncbi:MAG TPA: DUF885 family protein, partial [Gammaproteobacteria bacterium]|nr:DUF885 family protein [Gammaproteobacteria bacterium]